VNGMHTGVMEGKKFLEGFLEEAASEETER
jgi:hypothetical protein